MDEQRAIELCLKHRDPIGFEHLVRQYRREAYCHAYALLGDEQDALDACQDAFSKAFAAIPRLEELTRFYPWFYRILRNACLNMIDRRKTRQRFPETERGRSESEKVELESPASLLERREEQEAVWRTLQRMQPQFREILSMKYIQGYRYEEIAAVLEIPRGTVMSRLYHARMAFKDAFESPHEPAAQTKKENAK